MIVFTFEVNLMLGIIGIKVSLSSFVEALQKLFIDLILAFLFIKILVIIVLRLRVTSTGI